MPHLRCTGAGGGGPPAPRHGCPPAGPGSGQERGPGRAAAPPGAPARDRPARRPDPAGPGRWRCGPAQRAPGRPSARARPPQAGFPPSGADQSCHKPQTCSLSFLQPYRSGRLASSGACTPLLPLPDRQIRRLRPRILLPPDRQIRRLCAPLAPAGSPDPALIHHCSSKRFIVPISPGSICEMSSDAAIMPNEPAMRTFTRKSKGQRGGLLYFS